MEKDYLETAKSWLEPEFDEETRTAVFHLMNGDAKELEDAFYRTLEFGTGGLRGIMGVGTNRMNKYTVGMATQGLANYLKKNFCNQQVKVVISFDSRNNSQFFAKVSADVLMANGIEVYMFDNIRPTPELSFAIRYLKAQSGIMITASHNPKEYNGYKVFWEDGAQITDPHDKNIIAEVNKIADISDVKFCGETQYPNFIGEEVDKAFIDSVLSLTLSPEAVANHSDLKIVYTPLHGTGVRLVPRALNQLGFKNIIHVYDQDVSDGNFPTVVSPNPEEPSAMKMALEKGKETGADLVLGTDPDADRVAAAVRNDKGDLVLLTGNQTASILVSYMLTRWEELGKLDGNQYVVKTIVTTDMIRRICAKFGVRMYDVLTGFKYIAETVRNNEGKTTFICGGEESNGFNAGEFVRDKDSIVTCSLVCECAAWLADQGKTMWGYLQELYSEFGYHKEALLSLTKKGIDGLAQIKQMMVDFRNNPLQSIAGEKVVKTLDYLKDDLGLPKSDVLQFITEKESIISVRPSGTEPKIKFYFGLTGADADERVLKMRSEFENL